MSVSHLHFDTEEEWTNHLAYEQEILRTQLLPRDVIDWTPENLVYVGGTDISFVNGTDEAVASFIICELPSLRVVYETYERVNMKIPYIPGFLAFREAEPLMKLIQRALAEAPAFRPQCILVDGNGILHYRGFGLASHLGVLSGIPMIGCAKNLLCMDGLDRDSVRKEFDEFLVQKRAAGESCAAMPLVGNSGRTYGVAMAPTPSIQVPIYVSIGHRVSLETAVKVVELCSRFRIPEPIRQADLRSRDIIRRGG